MNVKDVLFRGIKRAHHGLYKLTGGHIGGTLGPMPVVFLTTTGRKSGLQRMTPLTVPITDGDTTVVVASYGGDSRHPAWYLNLTDNPEVLLDRGEGPEPMRARTANAEERAALWPRVTAVYKGYAGYQTKTDREIPLVLLSPR